jgi:NADH-quinone oxidoreductase subunit L
MEGPTPVSAMIHAATMVSAGVFLLVRMFPMYAIVLETSPDVMRFVAFIGAFTALFAATIAMAQWDIKRVLAYSTISQLGFMVAAIGIGAYPAAVFHLITHAFFKALLFLGSGSVIHGVEHGHHLAHEGHGHNDHAHATADAHGLDVHDDHGQEAHAPVLQRRVDGDLNPDDPQDMRNMGGLLGRMPITAWTFIIGGLSLAGFPLLTAGFWSKDELLASAWYGGNTIVFFTLALTALLTAFYTTRQIILTFFGKPRTVAAEHAPESSFSMTLPLLLIAPFAIGLGWLGIPASFPVLGGIGNWLEHQLEPFIEYMGVHVLHPTFNIIPLAASLIVALGGIFLGWLVYGRRQYTYDQVDPMRKALGPLWMLWHRKYYIDELYNQTIVAFNMWLAKILALIDDVWVLDPIVDGIGKLGVWFSVFLAAFDKYVIDGVVNFSGWISERTGAMLRNTQSGHVQVYLLVLALTLTVWLLLQALPIILTLA